MWDRSVGLLAVIGAGELLFSHQPELAGPEKGCQDYAKSSGGSWMHLINNDYRLSNRVSLAVFCRNGFGMDSPTVILIDITKQFVRKEWRSGGRERIPNQVLHIRIANLKSGFRKARTKGCGGEGLD